MWCPSVSLSVWANAWLAGAAAPDDVLDALSLWAPRHSVTAYDSVAALGTGLSWPDLTDAGAVSLLQTMRTAAGPSSGEPAIVVVLPIPGDIRGLTAGTQFQADAVTAGEAIIVARDGADGIGLVPDYDPEPRALSWTVYSQPSTRIEQHLDLGQAEYDLRAAVRSAADALGTLRAGAGGADVAD